MTDYYNVGDHIVITGHRYKQQIIAPMDTIILQEGLTVLDGLPLEVVGIGPPFLMCKRLYEKSFSTIDLRFVDCNIVPKSYAEGMVNPINEKDSKEYEEDEDDVLVSQLDNCPCCADPLTQRFESDNWLKACKSCGIKIVPIDWVKK